MTDTPINIPPQFFDSLVMGWWSSNKTSPTFTPSLNHCVTDKYIFYSFVNLDLGGSTISIFVDCIKKEVEDSLGKIIRAALEKLNSSRKSIYTSVYD